MKTASCQARHRTSVNGGGKNCGKITENDRLQTVSDSHRGRHRSVMVNQTRNTPTTINLPNGAPLVDAIADHIRKLRTNDPFNRVAVVTPSIFSAFFLKRAVTDKLCGAGGNGMFNIEFMRIEDVADRVFDARAHGPEDPPMSRLIASQLIQNSMLQLETHGPLLDHVQNDSTLTAVQNTLQELELLHIGTDNALAQLSGRSRAGLYPQLLEIHRRYTLDASKYLTREQKAAIASQTVVENHSSVSASLGQNIILVLAPHAPNAHTRLWEALRNLPYALSLNIVSIEEQSDAIRQTRFYSTMSAADEPRALIRNIMEDARNGVRFGEMAVLYPSVDYASRIRDALEAADIKSCGPSTKILAETPVGKFIKFFLTMLSDDVDMRRDAFTSWISSSPVVDPRTRKPVPAVPWEITTRQANISRFTDETDWANSLRRYANRMKRRAERAQDAADDDSSSINPDAYIEAAEHANSLRDFVMELLDRTRPGRITSWSGWIEWLSKVIARYSPPQYSEKDREQSGLDRIQEALRQVEELDAITQSDIDFARFSRTIQHLLSANIGGSSGWGSSVLVAPIAAGTGTSFKSVHIVGMAEGSLPGPGRTDPLLPDHLRRTLDPDESTLLTKRDRLKLNHDIFQIALNSAPSVRLYWNKGLLGATNEAYPSPWFVNEVQKASQQTNIPVKSLMDPDSEYVEPATSLADFGSADLTSSSQYEFRLRDIATRSQNPSERSQILRDPTLANLAAGHNVNKARTSDVFGPFDGHVEDTSINSLTIWETSATALERYAKCPYSYFLSHELKVDERIDPEESLTLSPLDRGTLVHAILERFLQNYPVDRSPTGRAVLREIASAELNRFQEQEFVGFNAIYDLEKAQIIRDLETWHTAHLSVLDGHEGELLTEQSFGFDADSLGQFQLNDGFLVQFRGKIDLIAISPEGRSAFVFDFKSGARSYSEIEKDVTDAGTKLQLPIYSEVASQMLGHPDIQSAFWFVFVSGVTKLRPQKKVWMTDAVEEFQPILSTLVNGIRKGAFPARQGDRGQHNNCTYCPFDAVCTSDRLIAWERKKSDPVLEKYVQLVEKSLK